MEMEGGNLLSTWDYIIFALFLLVSISIGIYYRFSGGRQKTVEEYMLANRQMSAIPVTMSLMSSFISAVTILGTSAENYLYGTQYLLLNFSYVIGTPIVNYVFLPVFFTSSDKISVYQYLDMRFGSAARLAAAVAFSLQMTLYMGVVLYAPSLAISAVTGVSKTAAILSVGLSCSFYSAIGGIKAVLVTDLLQASLMFFSVYAVIIKGLMGPDSPSFSQVFDVAYDTNHIEFFNFSFDPTTRHTVWGTLIGGLFTFLSLHAVNQAQIQSLRTLRSINTARKSLFASSIFVVVLSFSIGFMGLLMFAKFQKCDPLISGRICKADQLVPLFVSEEFKNIPGLTGFFIAGLMSGSLSTISTAINSLAAVTLEDFLQPVLEKFQIEMSPSKLTTTTKAIALVFGLVSIGMAFVAEQFTSVLTAAMTILGVVGGPILGLFSLGMLTTFASQKAAVPSFFFAICFGLWISFGGPKPPVVRLPIGVEQDCDLIWNSTLSTCPASASPPSSGSPPQEYFYLYRISYLWYSLIGFLLTFALGCLLSRIWPQKKKVDKHLLSPILEKFYRNASTT